MVTILTFVCCILIKCGVSGRVVEEEQIYKNPLTVNSHKIKTSFFTRRFPKSLSIEFRFLEGTDGMDGNLCGIFCFQDFCIIFFL